MPLGNGERYYSPQLGSFIQQDSFTGILAEVQTFNRYSYAGGNPTVYRPSGTSFPNPRPGRHPLLINMATGYNNARRAGWRRARRKRRWAALWRSVLRRPGMTMAFNGFTGTDAYTGRDLSTGERIFQGRSARSAWSGRDGLLRVLNTTANAGRAGHLAVQRGGRRDARPTQGRRSASRFGPRRGSRMEGDGRRAELAATVRADAARSGMAGPDRRVFGAADDLPSAAARRAARAGRGHTFKTIGSSVQSGLRSLRGGGPTGLGGRPAER